MVSMEYIFRFLRDLKNNNDKSWMDKNRDRYETAKERWTHEVEKIFERLAEHDALFEKLEPSKTVERINNNLLYHPEKPTYKHHFGCEPASDKHSAASIYISVGPQRSFIGGGIHNPNKESLDLIREKIDKEGDELKQVIESDAIQNYFGGLTEDERKLKTAPRDYDRDHKHIELLRRKDFTVMKQLTEDEVTGDGFIDIIEESYLKMKDFNSFFNEALNN